MKRNFVFQQDAFDQFFDWSIINKSIYKKIYELLIDIKRNPYEGKGKPEPLRHNLAGFWSRRIDREHRLVYRITSENNIEIISCKGHYDD